MTRDEAKIEIISNPRGYLREAKKRGTYICPLCGNGTGSQGDGMTTKDGKHFTCWKCHQVQSADVIDIIGLEYGLADFKDKLDKAIELYSLTITSSSHEKPPKRQPDKGNTMTENKAPIKANYKAYIDKAADALKNNSQAMAYLKSRGLTEATIEAFRLGYVENYNKPCILIPYSDNYYMTRAISEKEYRKPKSEEAGEEPLFNMAALKKSDPIFIVEGVFCAMSISQSGGEAVALGTTGDPKNLKNAIEASNYKGCFVLCLDNDEPGKNGQAKLKEYLEEKKLQYIEYNIAGEEKDPNELLQKDAEALKSNILKAKEEVKRALYGDIMGDNVEIYALEEFKSDIEDFRQGQSIKTGFNTLDHLTGGLYNGLYVLGAISSLGKTTLLHQLADQLAEQGQRVLYFSLEQSKMELLSKSIARGLYKDGKEGITSLDIRKGNYSSIDEPIRAYLSKRKGYINIIEGTMKTDIEYIRDYVGRYIELYNARPVVIIDYLQIIENHQEKDARAKVESNVKALKLLSRDYKIPVLCISNVNRANYMLPIDFESFKESGLIEYSADVILGLQLEEITSADFMNEKEIAAKRERIKDAMGSMPREVKLVCVKNRYGARYEVSFNYYPKYDYLEEKPEPGSIQPYEVNPFTGEPIQGVLDL